MGQQILKKIIEIKFSSLQQIELRKNHIYSLESLHRAYMPKMRELLIGKNYLVSVRDFRKLSCPHFWNFDMESNYIVDCHKLT